VTVATTVLLAVAITETLLEPFSQRGHGYHNGEAPHRDR
jgi:hypothetical protein